MAAGLFLILTTQSLVQIALGLALTGIGFGTFTSLGQEFAQGAASAAFPEVGRLDDGVNHPRHLSPISCRRGRPFIGEAVLVALLTVTWHPLRALAAKDRVARN